MSDEPLTPEEARREAEYVRRHFGIEPSGAPAAPRSFLGVEADPQQDDPPPERVDQARVWK